MMLWTCVHNLERPIVFLFFMKNTKLRSVCSASDFPTNVGFKEMCRISSDIEPFWVNWSDFGCSD